MNVRHLLACFSCSLCVCWALFLSALPALAQNTVNSGSSSGMGFKLTIGRPEGTVPPPFLVSSECWYHPIAGDPDPSSGATPSIASSIAYSWNDGQKRNLLSRQGPMTFDSSMGGYYWSFDLTSDTLRAFGSNSKVFVRQRDGTYFNTQLPAPYVQGTTPVTVVDASHNPIPNATVRIINSLDQEYSQGTTNAQGQVTFGQALYSETDAPYAPGLASDSYSISVTANGFADAHLDGSTGNSLANQALSVSMGSSASVIGSGPIGGSGGSGGSGGTCVAATVVPTDAGGSGGIPGWSDTSFPAAVTGTFLHSGSWTVTVNAAAAGPYVITGDCATAGNIGTLTMSSGSTAGSAVSCTTAAPGAKMGANFGTFTLAAGPNVLSIALAGGSYGAVKTFYLTPTAACGASSGGGSGGTADDSNLLDFVTHFWSKIVAFFQSLFTIDPADLQALKTAASNLANYGPLGVPAAVVGEWNDAFGTGYTGIGADGSQAGYWVIPLQFTDFDNATASLHAAPQGYVGTYQAPAPTPNYFSSFFSSLFPSQIDMTAYATYILLGRRLALIAMWLVVLFALVHRFTPELRI